MAYQDKLETVHRKLYEKGASLSREEVEKTILKHGAATRREEYISDLKMLDYISEPEEDQFEVSEPEAKETIVPSGEKERIHVTVDKQLTAGFLNRSRVVNSALAEALNVRKKLIRDHHDVTDKELEYIFDLVDHGLESQEGNERELSRKNKSRRKLYRDKFDVDICKQEERDHIEELRVIAFQLEQDYY
jgi:hypothetical protein